MPGQPHPDARIDPILTDLSIAYQNNVYIWENVFPIVPTEEKSARYYVFDKSEWTRDEAQRRAPGNSSEGGDFPLSDDRYNCEERAYHTKLPDESADTVGEDIDLEEGKVNFVTEKIMLKAERDIADLVFDAGNWDTVENITDDEDRFDDYNNSDPVGVFEDNIDDVESKTGQMVNTMVLGSEVWRYLKHHPQILDRMAVDNLRTATIDTLSAILEIDNILVGRARVNNAKRGADDNFERVWGKHCWLGHVADNPGPQIPSAGYTFIWPREGQIRGVRRWRDEDTHSDKIEAFQSDDKKVTGSDLGAFIQNAIS